jgi:hypothetical protein
LEVTAAACITARHGAPSTVGHLTRSLCSCLVLRPRSVCVCVCVGGWVSLSLSFLLPQLLCALLFLPCRGCGHTVAASVWARVAQL